jgi:hypothetical protein
MRDKDVTVRVRALSVISLLHEVCPSILDKSVAFHEIAPSALAGHGGSIRLRSAVMERAYDKMISVREAVVKLAGQDLLSRPQSAMEFFSSTGHASNGLSPSFFSQCLSDKGSSVRQRTIKVFGDFLQQHADVPEFYTVRTHMCRLLVDHIINPTEEATVRELVTETLRRIWFSDCGGTEYHDVNYVRSVARQIIRVVAGQVHCGMLFLYFVRSALKLDISL